MGISYSELADAVLETQKLLMAQGTFVNMQTDLTDHVLVRELWGSKDATAFEGGEAWRWEIQVDHNHSAKFVGLYEQDTSALIDNMTSAEVRVCHVNAYYTWDLREPSFQRGGRGIVKVLKSKNGAMKIALFELLEAAFWGTPTDPIDAKKTPYGVRFWLQRSAVEGFNGGNPAAFPLGRGGVSSITQPRFKNYTARYQTANKVDLVRKMRAATRRTNFRSPLTQEGPTFGKMKNGIYVNDTTVGILEEILEDQNMNLGNDLASKDGKTLFKGVPITYVPFLNLDTTDPVYMLDWRFMTLGTMSGWENNITEPYRVAGMHQVYRVDQDMSIQMVCTDPRRQTVISKA